MSILLPHCGYYMVANEHTRFAPNLTEIQVKVVAFSHNPIPTLIWTPSNAFKAHSLPIPVPMLFLHDRGRSWVRLVWISHYNEKNFTHVDGQTTIVLKMQQYFSLNKRIVIDIKRKWNPRKKCWIRVLKRMTIWFQCFKIVARQDIFAKESGIYSTSFWLM